MLDALPTAEPALIAMSSICTVAQHKSALASRVSVNVAVAAVAVIAVVVIDLFFYFGQFFFRGFPPTLTLEDFRS